MLKRELGSRVEPRIGCCWNHVNVIFKRKAWKEEHGKGYYPSGKVRLEAKRMELD